MALENTVESIALHNLQTHDLVPRLPSARRTAIRTTLASVPPRPSRCQPPIEITHGMHPHLPRIKCEHDHSNRGRPTSHHAHFCIFTDSALMRLRRLHCS